MCGRCRHVFNAFQSLSRTAESPADPPIADAMPAVSETPVAEIAHAAVPLIPLPTGTKTPDNTQDGISPTAAIATEMPAIVPPTPNVVSPAQPAIMLPDPPAAAATGRNPLLKQDKANNGRAGAGTGWWVSGVVLLSLTLGAQTAFYFRTEILSQFPEWRPLLSQWCERAGCSLPGGRDAAKFEIVTSDLVEASGKKERIQLTAILVNRSERRQDLPSIQLKLTDHANQVVASRNLHASDYLGRKIDNDDGLASNAELYVNLNLDVANKPLASGYGLAIFFP